MTEPAAASLGRCHHDDPERGCAVVAIVKPAPPAAPHVATADIGVAAIHRQARAGHSRSAPGDEAVFMRRLLTS